MGVGRVETNVSVGMGDTRRNHRALQIAIDGPVASGKSTVARQLAKRLGCVFLDTGAFYRAVAYLSVQRGMPLDEEAAIAELARANPPEVLLDATAPLGYRIGIGGQLLDEELFLPDLAQAVSQVAAMPSVRRHLVEAQRRFADERDIVMAGRDIGSVVLPDADFKFFLTASVDKRVERRLAELRAKGIAIDRAELRSDIERRDARDRNRAASPLVKAADAIEIDTSAMTVEQTVAALEELVRARASAAQAPAAPR